MMTPDGIMLGFVKIPGSDREHELVMHGSPMDLMKITTLLGLELNPDQKQALMDDTFTRQDGPLTFTDSNGSYVTVQPVSRASDFLAGAAKTAHDHGLPFPF